MSFKLSSEVVTGGVQKKPARTQFAAEWLPPRSCFPGIYL